MAFPKRYAELAARGRVPAGFVTAGLFLGLARPTWESLAAGGGIGLIGLALRAWAAGHLEKYQKLSTSGPFAHMRNPLYMGTMVVGLGFAVAGARSDIGILLVLFFALFYLPVIEEEERYLQQKFADFAEYQTRVPRFLPKLKAQYASSRSFRFALYVRNQEYQALAGFALVMALLAAKRWYLV